VRSAAS